MRSRRSAHDPDSLNYIGFGNEARMAMTPNDCSRLRATSVQLAAILTVVSLIIAAPRGAAAQPTYEVLHNFFEPPGHPNERSRHRTARVRVRLPREDRTTDPCSS